MARALPRIEKGGKAKSSKTNVVGRPYLFSSGLRRFAITPADIHLLEANAFGQTDEPRCSNPDSGPPPRRNTAPAGNAESASAGTCPGPRRRRSSRTWMSSRPTAGTFQVQLNDSISQAMGAGGRSSPVPFSSRSKFDRLDQADAAFFATMCRAHDLRKNANVEARRRSLAKSAVGDVERLLRGTAGRSLWFPRACSRLAFPETGLTAFSLAGTPGKSLPPTTPK